MNTYGLAVSAALFSLAALPAWATAQTEVLTLEVSGVLSEVNGNLYPNAQPGDPYTAKYTIEYEPGSDYDPDPTIGKFQGPATLDLQFGGESIIYDQPLAVYRVINDFFGFNDLVTCNINNISDANDALVSFSFLDLSQASLTDDSPPTEAALNGFPLGVTDDELRIFPTASAGTPVVRGTHTSATFTIEAVALPPECMEATVSGLVTTVNPNAYPGISVGDEYLATYRVEYAPDQDQDPDPDTGTWYGNTSVSLRFPSASVTVDIGPRPGVYTAINDFFNINDLVSCNVGEDPSPAGRHVSLSFLDTSLTSLVNDSAPTEPALNGFPLGIAPDELRVFASDAILGTPLITGRHHTGSFTVTTGLCSAPCPADTNGDGILDNGDIGFFVALFLAGDTAADFNADGILDNGDISTFVAAFLAGC